MLSGALSTSTTYHDVVMGGPHLSFDRAPLGGEQDSGGSLRGHSTLQQD